MKRIISWGRAKVKYFLNIGIIKNNSFANFFLHNIKKFKIDNVYNYCEYYKKPKNKVNNKSALISYLPKPLIPQKSKRDRTRFSNLGIAQYIPRALNELGYIVDIISYDDMAFFPKKNYDLFIGHGGINFEKLSKSLPEKTVQIYFSTGVYWKEFNIKEAKRLYDLAKRRGFLLKPDRSINHSEEQKVQVYTL